MERVVIRVSLLVGLLLVTEAVSQQAGAAGEFDPAGASIEQLHAALISGSISDEQLVRYYLDRVQRFDKGDPRINAMLSLNPDAIEQARKADKALKMKRNMSVLFGIPFVVKDNFDSVGVPTTAGSAVLAHSMPRTNAFVVQKLLEQGAILIGKANMSELASSYGRLGYSSAGGLTVNPYDTSRDVSGSSSGSAAAIAADFAAFALGTDTSGSIRGPANVAGLVGLRPTLGLISRSGVVPLSLTFDTVGILARTATDVAVVLDAIAAADAADAATQARPSSQPHYVDAAVAQNLRGARLGVVGNFRGANAEIDAAEQGMLETLSAEGAVLVPVTLPETYEHLWALVMSPVGQAEFRPQFERYLRTLSAGQPRTLAEFIDASASNTDSGRSPINPALLKALRDAQVTELTDSPTYIHLLTQVIPSLRAELQALMTTRDLRALVFSTMSCPATPRFDRADSSYVCHSDDSYKASYIAAVAGFPEVTVPAARLSKNLPAGYSFLGVPFSEGRLLSLANDFQRARGRQAGPALR
ncbi:MAG TPA: amidase family protein [Steroidobacteraceae bacterium]